MKGNRMFPQCGFSNTWVQVGFVYDRHHQVQSCSWRCSLYGHPRRGTEASLAAVQILNTLGAPYETVNILEDELLRSGMKEYSQWPTFPQVYIDGEFYGGCDIMIGISLLSIAICCMTTASTCLVIVRHICGPDLTVVSY